MLIQHKQRYRLPTLFDHARRRNGLWKCLLVLRALHRMESVKHGEFTSGMGVRWCRR